MILKFKYLSEDGRLEAFQNYTIAQNSSLTNTIVVTSTDSNAQNYKYCLEFLCYNYKNVPKAQYVSPILDYTQEGVVFAVPASLTQYKGHVDMQLTGYSPEDNSIVFKSINKSAKAFDVEGSLNALENEILTTPTIFKEFLDEIEYYRKTRDEFANDVKQDVNKIIQDMLKGNVFYKVTFRINGEIIKSMTVREGIRLLPPEYTLPDGCEVVEGWYDISKDRLWDFLEDSVTSDVVLTLNFMSKGIGMSAAGKIKDFANLTGDIYLPDYYNGKRVTHTENTVTNLADGVNLHFGYNLTNYLGILKAGSQVKKMLFPKDSKMRNRVNGVYTDKEEVGVVSFIFAPRGSASALYIHSDCQELGVYAISNDEKLTKIVIPPTVTGLSSNCITNTGITSITIPSSVTYCNSAALFNNKNLTSIYLEGDLSERINGGTFVDASVTPTKRPTLYVRPEHYKNYINRNLQNSYTIEVMSKEYMDENYNAKEV